MLNFNNLEKKIRKGIPIDSNVDLTELANVLHNLSPTVGWNDRILYVTQAFKDKYPTGSTTILHGSFIRSNITDPSYVGAIVGWSIYVKL